MIKKLFIVCIIVIGTTSCESKYNSDDIIPYECGNVEIGENEFVSMQVLPEQVSTDSPVKLIIENHTKEDMTYSAVFSLEYFNGRDWISIPLDIMFPTIGCLLKAGETAEDPIDLFTKKQNYKKGKYRINKRVTLDKTYHLCAEFEMK
ncbi:hypothetical protein FACS1894182_01600 [Bacteroidia bacterium]|nr:hypothetical protein FACS1894182_01600 [Bacteroidia bacterium]